MTVRILGSEDLADSIGENATSLLGFAVSGNLDYDVSGGFFYVDAGTDHCPIQTGDYLRIEGIGECIVDLARLKGGDFSVEEIISMYGTLDPHHLRGKYG